MKRRAVEVHTLTIEERDTLRTAIRAIQAGADGDHPDVIAALEVWRATPYPRQVFMEAAHCRGGTWLTGNIENIQRSFETMLQEVAR